MKGKYITTMIRIVAANGTGRRVRIAA